MLRAHSAALARRLTLAESEAEQNLKQGQTMIYFPRRSWPRKPLWSAIVALVIGASLTIVGCNRGSDDDDKPQKAASATKPAGDKADEGQKVKLTADAVKTYGLKVEKVQKHRLIPTFIAPARVAYDTEGMARVGSAVNGRIVAVNSSIGNQVRQGDALLTVESTELGDAQSDLLQKRTLLDAAVVAVEPAKAAYERAKALYAQQGVSLGELQKREGEYKAAQASEQAARGAREAAERKLAILGMSSGDIGSLIKSGQINPQYVVRSPITGTVIERNVTLGQLVGPSNDALLVLADMTTLWVLADVPEAKLREITVASPARILVPDGSPAIHGAVSFISPALDPGTHTAQVRIDVKTTGQSSSDVLRPGMFAQAELQSATKKEEVPSVIAVPEEALQTIDGHPCIFVADDDEPNTFNKRPVVVGTEVNGLVPILSGLKEKEEVVSSGAFILKMELAKSAMKDTDND